MEKGCLFTLSGHCLLGTERSSGGKEGLGVSRDQAEEGMELLVCWAQRDGDTVPHMQCTKSHEV